MYEHSMISLAPKCSNPGQKLLMPSWSTSMQETEIDIIDPAGLVYNKDDLQEMERL